MKIDSRDFMECHIKNHELAIIYHGNRIRGEIHRPWGQSVREFRDEILCGVDWIAKTYGTGKEISIEMED